MKEQVIIVTGASSGMGKVFAQQLLEEGHIVYPAARRIEKMQELKEKGAIPVQLDITKSEDIQNLVDRVMAEQGRIDVLVNNAGYAVYGAVEDTEIQDARDQFNVNLFGLGEITQAVTPHMRDAGKGKIINISSMGGKMYTPMGAWYHASKHALEGWSDCLRLELKPFGIDVVIVEPGIIITEFGEVMNEPLINRSGNTAYGKMANSVAKSVEDSYLKGDGSDPKVIARLISKAVAAKNPKTRYAGGKFAKPMMWIRKYMGDRIFDKIVMSQVK